MAAASKCKSEKCNRVGGKVGNAVTINRLLIVHFGIVPCGGAGVDESLGVEQPWEQSLLSSSVSCSPGSGASVQR